MSKHTPGPWESQDNKGAGLEIYAPIHLVETVQYPRPVEGPLMVFRLTEPAGHKLIACERWVQFEPEGWHAMQKANARLMSAAPEMLELCKQALVYVCENSASQHPEERGPFLRSLEDVINKAEENSL